MSALIRDITIRLNETIQVRPTSKDAAIEVAALVAGAPALLEAARAVLKGGYAADESMGEMTVEGDDFSALRAAVERVAGGSA